MNKKDQKKAPALTTLTIKSKVKAAHTSLNHNETPTKARSIKVKAR